MSRGAERALRLVAQMIEEELRDAIDDLVDVEERAHLSGALDLVWQAHDELARYRHR